MARKQMTIPGTGRKEHPEVEAAAEAFREVRNDRMDMSRREKQKKLELIAVMQAHKVKKYKFDDSDGEEELVEISEKVDVTVRKTGDANSEVGEGLPEHAGEGGIPKGLIDQAMADSANNVEVSEDGDVTVPDTAAPKAKRKAKKKS